VWGWLFLESEMSEPAGLDSLLASKLAVIGAGQMAEAFMGGLLAAGVAESDNIIAADVSVERRDVMKRRFGIRVTADNREAADHAASVLLAVKPQSVESVLRDLAPVMDGHLLISIAAGVSIQRLSSVLPASARVVRVMSNAPALVGEGMSAISYGPGVSEADRKLVRTVLEAMGRVVEIDEQLMDAVTGLSGSGPAYVCLAVEALADGGVKMGLPRGIAQLLATQTMLGAARMLLETGDHPGCLKDRVASPGGTTIAGLHALERGGLRACLIAAVEAATRRSRELNG
jgi:pyrroline-5-carboxylate reductase